MHQKCSSGVRGGSQGEQNDITVETISKTTTMTNKD